MTRLSTAEVEAALSRAERGERVVLQREGKDVAAVVPLEDLELLQRLAREEEDRRDVEEARKRLADPDDKTVPYDEARRSLGLR